MKVESTTRLEATVESPAPAAHPEDFTIVLAAEITRTLAGRGRPAERAEGATDQPRVEDSDGSHPDEPTVNEASTRSNAATSMVATPPGKLTTRSHTGAPADSFAATPVRVEAPSDARSVGTEERHHRPPARLTLGGHARRAHQPLPDAPDAAPPSALPRLAEASRAERPTHEQPVEDRRLEHAIGDETATRTRAPEPVAGRPAPPPPLPPSVGARSEERMEALSEGRGRQTPVITATAGESTDGRKLSRQDTPPRREAPSDAGRPAPSRTTLASAHVGRKPQRHAPTGTKLPSKLSRLSGPAATVRHTEGAPQSWNRGETPGVATARQGSQPKESASGAQRSEGLRFEPAEEHSTATVTLSEERRLDSDRLDRDRLDSERLDSDRLVGPMHEGLRPERTRGDRARGDRAHRVERSPEPRFSDTALSSRSGGDLLEAPLPQAFEGPSVARRNTRERSDRTRADHRRGLAALSAPTVDTADALPAPFGEPLAPTAQPPAAQPPVAQPPVAPARHPGNTNADDVLPQPFGSLIQMPPAVPEPIESGPSTPGAFRKPHRPVLSLETPGAETEETSAPASREPRLGVESERVTARSVDPVPELESRISTGRTVDTISSRMPLAAERSGEADLTGTPTAAPRRGETGYEAELHADEDGQALGREGAPPSPQARPQHRASTASSEPVSSPALAHVANGVAPPEPTNTGRGAGPRAGDGEPEGGNATARTSAKEHAPPSGYARSGAAAGDGARPARAQPSEEPTSSPQRGLANRSGDLARDAESTVARDIPAAERTPSLEAGEKRKLAVPQPGFAGSKAAPESARDGDGELAARAAKQGVNPPKTSARITVPTEGLTSADSVPGRDASAPRDAAPPEGSATTPADRGSEGTPAAVNGAGSPRSETLATASKQPAPTRVGVPDGWLTTEKPSSGESQLTPAPTLERGDSIEPMDDRESDGRAAVARATQSAESPATRESAASHSTASDGTASDSTASASETVTHEQVGPELLMTEASAPVTTTATTTTSHLAADRLLPTLPEGLSPEDAEAIAKARWTTFEGPSGDTRTRVLIEHPELGLLRLEIALEEDGIDVRVLAPSLLSALRLERDERELRAFLREHGARLAALHVEHPDAATPPSTPPQDPGSHRAGQVITKA